MNLLKLLKKSSISNSPKIFECINFTENTSDSTYMLFTSPLQFYDEYNLWDNIQRDILLGLMKGHFTIVHLDKLLCKTMTLDQLDDEIGKLYPVFQNNEGDYFIEVMPGDIRLLTELMNTNLIWECGNLLHIAIFKEQPNLLNDNFTFENAEVVIHSFYDNLGFYIDVHNPSSYSHFVENTVKSILHGYHVIINKTG